MASRCAPRTRFLNVAISDDDIERVRATVSIVDVVGQHVQLRRTGRNWVGLCPFHGEKTPSFNVREETGRYKCFGCDASGDIFTFVQQTEHLEPEFSRNRISMQVCQCSCAPVIVVEGFHPDKNHGAMTEAWVSSGGASDHTSWHAGTLVPTAVGRSHGKCSRHLVRQ